MSQGPVSRRDFSRYLATLALGAGAASPFALQLAAMGTAAAQSSTTGTSSTSYKALVCLFMFGGNDGHNTVLATDSDSWGRYFAARNIGVDQIALMPVGTAAQAVGATSPFNGRTVSRTTPEFWGGVVPIVPNTVQKIPAGTNATTRTFALHPYLSPLVPLFNAGRLAIQANVGTLITPTTKAQYVAKSVPLPVSLYSHNDQQAEWQSGAPLGGSRYGYGGLMADLVLSGNPNSVFTAISVAGNAVFMSGKSTVQYQCSTSATPAVVITGATASNLFGSTVASARMSDIIRDTSSASYFASDQATVVKRSMDSATQLNSAFATAAVQGVPAPPTYTNPLTNTTQTNSLAVQLQTIARLIAANSTLGAKRQVFFVSLGGFDTHQFENTTQPNLLAEIAQALVYFDGALSNINGADMRSAVTTFTCSDFNRTFTSNGSGTDHAWGSHHFMMGGAVKGGTIYGQYPTLGVDQGSFANPDMSGNALIPTTSVDQYIATLGSWFGTSAADLATIFPNLANFSTKNLAFV